MFQFLQHLESGTVVLLGKHHVKTDHRNTITIEQFVHQFRHLVATPGPATFFLQAFFVDVEDDNTLVPRLRQGQQ